jgi:hypothetical protein
VRPSKAFRRALGSRFRARVRISIFDAAGNVRVAEPVLKVKAAKKKKAKKKGSR